MSEHFLLREISVNKIALNLQKIGWLVGKSFDECYDLLAYNPKHYKMCLIKVMPLSLSGRRDTTEFSGLVKKAECGGLTHLIFAAEPQGWYYVAKKDEVLFPHSEPDYLLFGGCVDSSGKESTHTIQEKNIARFKDAWDDLLR